MAREILIGATSNDDSGTQHSDTLQTHISGQNILKRCQAMLSIMYLRPRGADKAEFMLKSRSYDQYTQAVTGGEKKKSD
ncbi:hypothetical protein BKA82DRAFT_1006756, partial [Pisolithus tinctorius]